MRVLCEDGKIADAVVAGAAPEIFVESQRRKHSVAARAAARDHAPASVHQVFPGQKTSAVDAVFDIDNPPVRIEALPVLTPKTCAAAVIHIENGNPAAGPVLNSEA